MVLVILVGCLFHGGSDSAASYGGQRGLREARDAVMAFEGVAIYRLRARLRAMTEPAIEIDLKPELSPDAVRQPFDAINAGGHCRSLQIESRSHRLIETFPPRTAPIPLDSRCPSKRSRYGSRARAQSRRRFLQRAA